MMCESAMFYVLRRGILADFAVKELATAVALTVAVPLLRGTHVSLLGVF